MNKFKVFVNNILIYGFGSVISRIIPFIMLPVVTRLMPNAEYYGLNDLSITIISVGQAIAVFGMYDAMFRLFFDKEDKEFQKQICSTALFCTMMTTLAVFFIMIVLRKRIAEIVFNDAGYSYLALLSAFSVLIASTNNIVAAPTKIQNESKVFMVVNTLSPILSYSLVIPLLLRGYYTIALPLAHLAAAMIIESVFIIRNRKWFSFKSINSKHIAPLLKIAVPLMPSFLIYWIYNSADRLMIQHYLGAGEVGIYAIGAKLGQISNLIYTAFTGGWLYFSYSTMKDDKQVENTSRILEYLGIISFSISVLVCGLSYIVFKVVFPEEYLPGYRVAPYLFLAPLLQMLFQVAGNQFIIMKKSWASAFILFSGAVFNVLANVILIPRIGIVGASVATLLGYFVADCICIVSLLRIKKILITRRFIICALLTITFFVIWSIFLNKHIVLGLIFSLMAVGIMCILYRKDIIKCVFLFASMIKNRNGTMNEKD